MKEYKKVEKNKKKAWLGCCTAEGGECIPSEEKMAKIYNFLVTKEEHELLASIIIY